MVNVLEKIRLKDYEFWDGKFTSKASKRVRRKMRKFAKRFKNLKEELKYL